MTVSAFSARRAIAVAVGIGIVLRLTFALGYWIDKPLTHDEHEYLALARSLGEGRGLVYDAAREVGTAQQFPRAPGYPAFLAVLGTGHGEHASAPARVKVVQSFVGGLTIWLIGVIALRAAGPRAGVAAAAIAAVYPPLVFIPSYVFSETVYSALALAAARTLQAASRRGGAAGRAPLLPAIAAGALIGAAVLVRPAMLFFLPVALPWLLARRQLAVAVAVVAAAAAVVAPWTARNLRVHDRFILVAAEGGVTFWTGNHPLARGEGDLAANPELKRAELEFRRAHGALSAEALEPLYYRDAFRWIAANPGAWLWLLARKAFYSIVPVGPSYTLHSTKYWAASAGSYALVLPFSLVGFRRLRHRREPPTAVLLLGISAVLVGLVFFPQERFRIPVIDPVLIIAAAAALAASDDDPEAAA